MCTRAAGSADPSSSGADPMDRTLSNNSDMTEGATTIKARPALVGRGAEA